MKALRDLRHSELMRHAKSLESGKYPLYRTRLLTPEEISLLEQGQNECEDWSKIRVDLDFDPLRIKRCFLSGEIFLPRFFGTLLGPDGVPFPAGIYDSTVHHCILENAHIYRVGVLSRMVISSGCILRNLGSLVVSGRTSFGAAREISVGTELGGRILRAWPEIPFDAASQILLFQGDQDTQKLWTRSLLEFKEQISSTMGFVGKDSILSNTPSIRNSWIGPYTRIEGAQKVHDSTLLSTVEQPCAIRDGAIVEHSLLQWGAQVRTGAYVAHSLLCEESGASKHAKVVRSILGSNTHIQEGEVTASLLGPFVAFHHQSLLISVLWPEGMGNVSHAAAVGSNHTGRQPDQECFPGRGMFFGLGSIIKFPAHYREAPWSLIAPGVTAPPQRVEFPFSLISAGRNPKAFRNEIVPGWMLRYNAFALMRSEAKFAARNKSRRQNWPADLFGAECAQKVVKAYVRLNSVTDLREVYTDEHIPGLGKNYLTETHRQKALRWYQFYLERYAMLCLISQLEKEPALLRSDLPPRKLLQGDLLREISRMIHLPESIALIVKHYRNMEKHWCEQALADFGRDEERGMEIQEDYLLVHDKSSATQFVQDAFENAQARYKELIKRSKNPA